MFVGVAKQENAKIDILNNFSNFSKEATQEFTEWVNLQYIYSDSSFLTAYSAMVVFCQTINLNQLVMFHVHRGKYALLILMMPSNNLLLINSKTERVSSKKLTIIYCFAV